MLKSIFLYSPCILAITAIGVSLLRHRLKHIDWWMIGLLVMLLAYFFADAWCFLPTPSVKWSIAVDIIGKISLMGLMPTAIFWYWYKYEKKNAPWWYYLIYLLPAIMLIALCTLYGTIGKTEAMASGAYYYWKDPSVLLSAGTKPLENLYKLGVVTFNYFMMFETLGYVGHFVWEIVVLLKARPLMAHKKYMLNFALIFMFIIVVVMVRMYLGYDYLIEHDVVCALFYAVFSASILVFMYFDVCDALVDDKKQLTEHAVHRLLNQAPSIDKVRFERLMLMNKWCYKKGLTEEMVAKELGTNRTYLAYMMKTYYGMTFTAWVMDKRIKYAQRLMLENPDAKQAEIADACGFADSSVFSRSFSKTINMTPREWFLINKK